jgi:hypothetical protein
MWLKSPTTFSSAKSDTTPTSPDVIVGVDPGRQSEPEPVASSSVVEPDPGPGRTCSGHGAEATSTRSGATATGAVFGSRISGCEGPRHGQTQTGCVEEISNQNV